MATQKWWQKSVVYQIYPRSFQDSNGDGIGDLPGITKRLPYIAQLGADVIWLSPIYASPNDDNGYDISDYQAIMPEFGTMDDFDQMLETAHSLGLKIVMDLVVNHTSDEHNWFKESRKSKDNPYRDYYIWRDPKPGMKGGEPGAEPNNWGSCFGGSAWEYDETTGQYYLHLFSKKQPDLNWDNPKVRDEVFSMMTWWLDKGVNGFRMDVISLISKPEGLPDGVAGPTGFAGLDICATGPHLHEYLREMNKRVLSKYDTITVGECPGVSVEEARNYASLDGSELNMIFHFEHMSTEFNTPAGRYALSKVELPPLKAVLDKWEQGLEGYAWNSLYWNNHDQPRAVSRFGNDSDEYRELSAKMLGTCLHMMKGTPYVYEGEELGMTNCPWNSLDEINDIDSLNNVRQNIAKGLIREEDAIEIMRRQSRDNARTPMQWDDSANGGFTTGTPWLRVNPNYVSINAKEEVARQSSVFHYYRRLIELRKKSELIVQGDFRMLLPDSKEIFAYMRTLGEEKLLVACNFTDKDVSFTLPDEFEDGRRIIGNYEDEPDSGALRPYEAVAILI
ncbi:glycoside hydrolase family 13 protein [Butyrivibrio sp. MC2013]|uniref:glycoside hydrolase family 13 protein n=1 Tax=Butyrivibrio sp. MC2013 TaxID=1280686 RepID=UPI0004124F8F|nr:alpha-glucosidase [Butyrivibrio sp. MC2013]